nr:hypothetical protein GCM10020092_006030 [Actinoplanes digitatis]
MERTRFFRRPVVWIILVIIGAIALSTFFTNGPSYQRVDTSVVLERLNQPGIKNVIQKDKEQTLQLELATPERFDSKTTDKIETQYPYEVGDEIWNDAQEAKKAGRVTGTVDTTVSGDGVLLNLLFSLLPVAILVILLLLFMSQMQGGGSRVLNFGKSKAKMLTKDMPKTTFADVAGADEAVEELQEIKDFLQNPAKYQALGAKIPKGVLLFGQPGTGKTLLARAVAGEAGVPFYSISGSDFVEMFVGVGASRVRDLFEQAKANALGHRLRRRDRRGRPAPRRRHGRRPRRARADAQPAARRDGRLRHQGRRHPHRRHQPARHPRPGAAAPGPLRPPDPGRQPGHGGPQGHPAGARQGQAVHARRRPRLGGPAHTRLLGCRPGKRDQRGRAADGP